MWNLFELSLVLILSGVLACLLLWVGHQIMWLVPWLHDPVYVPTKDRVLADMLSLAKIKPGERAVDLGSGDGKVVIALAQAGAMVDGYEIHPWLVWRSRQRIRELGLQQQAKIHWRSFWKVDFSQYDVICLYTAAHLMERLEGLIRPQLRPKARVISNTFKFPSWPEDKSKGLAARYI